MQREVSMLQSQGNAVKIMLDAYSRLDTDSKFSDMVHLLDLCDLHSADSAPSTYIGASSSRIDYMLGYHKVQSALRRQGSLSYFEGPQADHRGLYADLSLETLFGFTTDASPLDPAASCPLTPGNPEKVASYHASMLQYYDDHNMIARIDRLFERHTKQCPKNRFANF